MPSRVKVLAAALLDRDRPINAAFAPAAIHTNDGVREHIGNLEATNQLVVLRDLVSNYCCQAGAVQVVHHLIEHAAVRAPAAGLGQAIGVGALKKRNGIDEDASRLDFVGALQQQTLGIVELGLQHLGAGKDKL